MTTPTGRIQFFALEAGDYLDRLALIAGRSTGPNTDEFVRLTRALRGAALMAGISTFSVAAAGLEQVAKAHRDGQWPWDQGHTDVVDRAVTELRRLTARAGDWGPPDDEAATGLGRRLVAVLTEGGVSLPPQPTPPPSDELPPSVRAFIAREGALVAGSLEHAAQAAELGPVDQPIDLVLHRLQPLRGLATLPALSPLPEFLDAVELTIHAVRDDAAPPAAARGLRAVAGALTRLAREIAEHGKVDADAPEIAGAAIELLTTFGSDDDVVDIAALFHEGDRDPVVRRGTPPERAASPDPAIDLVGLADRLRQASDQLETASSGTARTLHLFSLSAELRPVARAMAGERPALTPLLDALTGAIRRGAAAADPPRFAGYLRDVAESLTQASLARDAVFLTDDLSAAVGAIEALGAARHPPPTTPAAPVHAEPAHAEPVHPEPAPVETPDGAGEVVPIESLAPAPSPFERSFSTLFRLDQPPIEPPGVPTPVQPEPPTSEALVEPLPAGVVDIEALLYRGRRALERADVVRRELSAALDQREPFESLQPLVSELIDLVPLALAE